MIYSNNTGYQVFDPYSRTYTPPLEQQSFRVPSRNRVSFERATPPESLSYEAPPYRTLTATETGLYRPVASNGNRDYVGNKATVAISVVLTLILVVIVFWALSVSWYNYTLTFLGDATYRTSIGPFTSYGKDNCGGFIGAIADNVRMPFKNSKISRGVFHGAKALVDIRTTICRTIGEKISNQPIWSAVSEFCSLDAGFSALGHFTTVTGLDDLCLQTYLIAASLAVGVVCLSLAMFSAITCTTRLVFKMKVDSGTPHSSYVILLMVGAICGEVLTVFCFLIPMIFLDDHINIHDLTSMTMTMITPSYGVVLIIIALAITIYLLIVILHMNKKLRNKDAKERRQRMQKLTRIIE